MPPTTPTGYRVALTFPGYPTATGEPETYTYATPHILAHQLAFLARVGVRFDVVRVDEATR